MKARSQFSSILTKPSKVRKNETEKNQTWTLQAALQELRRYGRKRNVEGMARYGIRAKKVYGVSKPRLDEIARKIGKNHEWGLKLWATGIHDARLLGALISEPSQVTSGQMERWVKDFDNWDICDGTCCHLFVDAKPAWSKAFAWSERTREFEKRAGFALGAFLAVHDKAANDRQFEEFLGLIEREAWDERNFVRKAVNWALRNIGKRSQKLNEKAIDCAERIRRNGVGAARWIAGDALRELQSDEVQIRLRRKNA